jgi:protein gp37
MRTSGSWEGGINLFFKQIGGQRRKIAGRGVGARCPAFSGNELF